MRVQIDGVDLVSAIEVAAIVGSIVAMLVIGLIVYLMVRPVRRPEPKRPEPDRIESEELLRQMDVMERRLALIERAVADQRRDEEELFEAGAGRPETRRRK